MPTVLTNIHLWSHQKEKKPGRGLKTNINWWLHIFTFSIWLSWITLCLHRLLSWLLGKYFSPCWLGLLPNKGANGILLYNTTVSFWFLCFTSLQLFSKFNSASITLPCYIPSTGEQHLTLYLYIDQRIANGIFDK